MNQENYTGRAVYIKGEQDLSVEQRTVAADENKVVVKISRGGICGSDIHYYYHGGIGDLKLKHPMLLGHEVIGTVVNPGKSSTLAVNQKVAINPSLPCGHCEYCHAGKENHCTEMFFFGSAMRNPHVHGGFADYLTIEPERCVPYATTAPDNIMVFAEPLSVAIHAVNQAGSLVGKRVLVSGAGPIGCLIVAAAKASGALSVTAFDISDHSCEFALKMGADQAINSANPALTEPFTRNKGTFDIVFEASGIDVALQLAIQAIKPTGTLVQVGNSKGLTGVPMMNIVAKELNLKGSFRFRAEFTTAVNWLETGRINPLPLVTAEIDATQAEEAIRLASDKKVSAKVQLIF
ncbi:TPA: alcohol dehydrogenase catalytic domain-containing protein [Serratia fonticola]